MIFHFLIDDPDVDHNCLHDVCWFSQHDTRTENKHTSDQSIKKWSLSRKSFCKICIFLSVGGIAKGVTGYFRGHGNLLALSSWQFFGKSFSSKTNNYLCWDISAISARHVNNTVVPEEMAPLWRIILLLQYKSDKVFMIWFIVLICSQRCPRLLEGDRVPVLLVSLRCKLISHPEEHVVIKIIIVLRISSIIVHFNPNQIQLFNISAAITIPVKIW